MWPRDCDPEGPGWGENPTLTLCNRGRALDGEPPPPNGSIFFRYPPPPTDLGLSVFEGVFVFHKPGLAPLGAA